MSATDDRPRVFISYAHEDQGLARAIAAGLEERGLRVWVDENELLPGDSIIEQISTAVAGVDFFCALVSEASRESNWCRKELSLAITQGLGREGATIIPVRVGDVGMPDTLVDVLYVQLNPTDPTEAVERIAAGVRGHRRRKQQLGEKAVTQEALAEEAEAPAPEAPATASPSRTQASDAGEFEPIRIVGVVKEGVGQPRNDETRGSALYRIPLRLSSAPSSLWAELFKRTWDRPPAFTTMHRPGIAHVDGDTVVLDGTEMRELEQYHVATLRLVVDKVNEEVARIEEQERRRREREERERQQHRQEVDEVANRLRFD